MRRTRNTVHLDREPPCTMPAPFDTSEARQRVISLRESG